MRDHGVCKKSEFGEWASCCLYCRSLGLLLLRGRAFLCLQGGAGFALLSTTLLGDASRLCPVRVHSTSK